MGGHRWPMFGLQRNHRTGGAVGKVREMPIGEICIYPMGNIGQQGRKTAKDPIPPSLFCFSSILSTWCWCADEHNQCHRYRILTMSCPVPVKQPILSQLFFTPFEIPSLFPSVVPIFTWRMENVIAAQGGGDARLTSLPRKNRTSLC